MGGSAVEEPPPTFDVLTAAEYEVDPDPIGLGTFGSVHFALTPSNKHVAVKAISKGRTKALAEAAGQEATVETEVELLREVGTKKHRNILKFYGAWEDERYVYVAQQLCAGGELPDWLLCPAVAAEGYSEAIAARVTYDVLQAVCFIHELGVVHRDIKPQNLMFTEPKPAGLLKLIDFGLATRWVEGASPPLDETCGTIDYMAPETLLCSYGKKVDVWAAGVLLHILLSGKHPFRGPSRAATESRIFAVSKAPLAALGGVSEGAQSFLSSLLLFSTEERPSAKQALKHPWLKTRHAPAAPPLSDEIPQQLLWLCENNAGSAQFFDSGSTVSVRASTNDGDDDKENSNGGMYSAFKGMMRRSASSASNIATRLTTRRPSRLDGEVVSEKSTNSSDHSCALCADAAAPAPSIAEEPRPSRSASAASAAAASGTAQMRWLQQMEQDGEGELSGGKGVSGSQVELELLRVSRASSRTSPHARTHSFTPETARALVIDWSAVRRHSEGGGERRPSVREMASALDADASPLVPRRDSTAAREQGAPPAAEAPTASDADGPSTAVAPPDERTVLDATPAEAEAPAEANGGASAQRVEQLEALLRGGERLRVMKKATSLSSVVPVWQPRLLWLSAEEETLCYSHLVVRSGSHAAEEEEGRPNSSSRPARRVELSSVRSVRQLKKSATLVLECVERRYTLRMASAALCAEMVAILSEFVQRKASARLGGACALTSGASLLPSPADVSSADVAAAPAAASSLDGGAGHHITSVAGGGRRLEKKSAPFWETQAQRKKTAAAADEILAAACEASATAEPSAGERERCAFLCTHHYIVFSTQRCAFLCTHHYIVFSTQRCAFLCTHHYIVFSTQRCAFLCTHHYIFFSTQRCASHLCISACTHHYISVATHIVSA
ncbi:hypothetical protein AB1Y20_016135 [Prymnesium parvum]|uniref:Protein kinase domain-containing protein n=1 Tax=Prymnesium parvum TaxID=97485 RepID=A0AB34K3E2_PRYPA